MIRCIEGGKYDGILGNISTANHESLSDVPEHSREYWIIPSHLNKEMLDLYIKVWRYLNLIDKLVQIRHLLHLFKGYLSLRTH